MAQKKEYATKTQNVETCQLRITAWLHNLNQKQIHTQKKCSYYVCLHRTAALYSLIHDRFSTNRFTHVTLAEGLQVLHLAEG